MGSIINYMDRRSFIQGLASILGLSVAVHAKPKPILINEGANGPFCVEILDPVNWQERGLPLFDNIKQAQNFAIARMNIMRRQGVTDGKIIVTTPAGDEVQSCQWGQYHSTTIARVDGDGNYFH